VEGWPALPQCFTSENHSRLDLTVHIEVNRGPQFLRQQPENSKHSQAEREVRHMQQNFRKFRLRKNMSASIIVIIVFAAKRSE